jgi:hypothetical protein
VILEKEVVVVDEEEEFDLEVFIYEGGEERSIKRDMFPFGISTTALPT